MLAHLFKVCLLCAFSLYALPQSNDTTAAPEVQFIPHQEFSFIEEASLPFNTHAARLILSIPSEIDNLERPVSFFSDPSDDISWVRKVPNPESLVKDVNAMRILAFTIQPGERITFTLKSEASKVRLGVYPDSKSTKVKAAIMKANNPPIPARSRKLEFTNPTKEPYNMRLFVYGMHGYEYRLDWESKLKK